MSWFWHSDVSDHTEKASVTIHTLETMRAPHTTILRPKTSRSSCRVTGDHRYSCGFEGCACLNAVPLGPQSPHRTVPNLSVNGRSITMVSLLRVLVTVRLTLQQTTVDPILPDLPSDTSAVEAFAETFSPPSSSRHPGTNNLPAELLFIIFNLALDDEDDDTFKSLDLEWDRFDARSPTLFPFAVAAVCSLWRDIVSLIPDYWRLIVIFIDSPIPPPSAIASQFLWSHDLLLDVIVTRRVFDHPCDDQHERTRVMSIMKTYIYPNMHRIRKLRIDVRLSSSLPSFPHDIRGVTTNLVYLELSCREDDGGCTVPTNDREWVASTQHQYPALSTLFIDGRNYFNACKKPAEWADMVANVNDLVISRYRPRTGESFSLRDFILPLQLMSRLGCLDITDLALCASASRVDSMSRPWLHRLELSDLADFQSIAELFDSLYAALEITIFHCALGDHAYFAGNMYLKLKGIDANQDLASFLCAWDGFLLEIVNCPGFTDHVLDKMGARGEWSIHVRGTDA